MKLAIAHELQQAPRWTWWSTRGERSEGDLMKGTEKERWMVLCEQAANETDSAKLLKLITEINRLLDEKSKRIEHKQTVES